MLRMGMVAVSVLSFGVTLLTFFRGAKKKADALPT